MDPNHTSWIYMGSRFSFSLACCLLSVHDILTLCSALVEYYALRTGTVGLSNPVGLDLKVRVIYFLFNPLFGLRDGEENRGFGKSFMFGSMEECREIIYFFLFGSKE